MFSGYYQPQDNIVSVIPCSPEMSIRTTIADRLYDSPAQVAFLFFYFCINDQNRYQTVFFFFY